MYLKQLKLAGFKSFVDPVTIPLQNSLVAVVGPNGCGKSNIIDAVRWVMGESSAKNLRGESMSDVIFGGSSQRKALGQASVELLFDNSMGSLSGQYASYQEIAVKRAVTRDGESFYYLNGTRCRRRDITDIFLGTGAGARSYSIIGQGTISRLIEARPEELRAYLEEAAGTSKYKERRRETLQRIATTRENLVRVADIRDELAKQLNRLEQQAKTAIRYKTLCDQERELKAKIAVLKWQGFETHRNEIHEKIQQLQLTMTAHQSCATNAYQLQMHTQLRWNDENEALQVLQMDFHQHNTEIARLEADRLQQQREKQRLALELERIQGDCLQFTQQIETDTALLQDCCEERGSLETQILIAREQFIEKQKQFEFLQVEEQSRQSRLRELQHELNQVQNTMQLNLTQASHNNQRIQEIKVRLQRIDEEKSVLQAQSGHFDVSEQEALQANLQNDVAQQEEAVAEAIHEEKNLTEKLAISDKSIHEQKECVYQLSTQVAALQAWISSVLGRGDSSNGTFGPEWDDKTRLAEVIHVEQDWAPICEMIFSDVLQGIVTEEMPACIDAIRRQSIVQGVVVTAKEKRQVISQLPLLADKIHGIWPDYGFDVETIYAASSLDEALSWLPSIRSDESIVTQDGYWLAQGWIRIFNLQKIQESSVLVRQEACGKLQDSLKQAELILRQFDDDRAAIFAELTRNKQNLSKLQDSLSEMREQLRQCCSELALQKQRMEHVSAKTLQLSDEQEELNSRLEELLTIHVENNSQAEQAQAQKAILQQNLTSQNEEFASFQTSIKPAQQVLEDVRKSLHELELRMERAQLKVSQLEESLLRDHSRLATLKERLTLTTSTLEQLLAPDESSENDFASKLRQRQALEEQLNEKKQQINVLHEELGHCTQLNKEEEAKANAVKELIQQAQIEEQVLAAKANGVLEVLIDSGLLEPNENGESNLEPLLSSLAPGATLEMHEHELLQLVEKIKRLGAINLAAIDEYQIESERKKHLDQQNQDLVEALTLLESAIAKMDKEMLTRFQTLFTEVNNRFQILFPRLFGGGHASLELTCDNLLEAGVVVMARPPGKRNSSIHLLSGGEKAMTAVALVFAIFQLNPSPFCMLDEVDAPLDEVNIGRFCDLMKEMAGLVQFLFITHNKTTMKLAEQLIGVTMREPGVSRIVAVDVEQALVMSDT